MGEPVGETVAEGGLIRAAGAVVWRPGPAGPEIVLVHRPKYDDWTFPKGKLKNGEHVLTGVLREVEEETGLSVRLGRRLPTTTYLKDGRPKRVDYWAAAAGTAADGSLTANDEVDLLRWLPPHEAERLLSYERDVDLLQEFTAGPRVTRPLVILRHASAGEKKDWRDDDALRPLDARGRAEAIAFARLLGAFGPVRLLSSATARCVETLLPYALETDVSVATERPFTVEHATAGEARERLAELVGDGVPTVVCTHGEIVADLVTELCRRLGEKVPDDPSLRKGSFWVAHLSVDDHSGAIKGIAALEKHASL